MPVPIRSSGSSGIYQDFVGLSMRGGAVCCVEAAWAVWDLQALFLLGLLLAQHVCSLTELFCRSTEAMFSADIKALLLALLVQESSAANKCACSKLLVRRECLSDDHTRERCPRRSKASYTKAVECLQSKPGTMQHLFDGVRSRFDDYQDLHINLVDLYHFTVGSQLPGYDLPPRVTNKSFRVLSSHVTMASAVHHPTGLKDADTQAKFLASPVFDTTYGVWRHVVQFQPTGTSTYADKPLGNGPYVDTSKLDDHQCTGAHTLQDGRRFLTKGLEVSGITYHSLAGGRGIYLLVVSDIGEDVPTTCTHPPGERPDLLPPHHANLGRLCATVESVAASKYSAPPQSPTSRARIQTPSTSWAMCPYTNITLDTNPDYWELLGNDTGSRYVKIAERTSWIYLCRHSLLSYMVQVGKDITKMIDMNRQASASGQQFLERYMFKTTHSSVNGNKTKDKKWSKLGKR
ncbi:hypothetical protein QBC46DRAFT_403401 [Diplogelasinospora grovesii]|uniref:Uncharacterized protein n=1 Tax=Diplogelasinospora grovesii TaxID=303347 RepID=A0AAN6S9S5_9PEZI|nr:hypothetical protein QBC46DRAFT_403401 [Diplogelasinospora grovesii]